MLNDRPIRRGQGDNRKPEADKVLLVFKPSVPSHEHLKCGIFRCFKQITVFQSAPAQVSNGRRFVVQQMPAKLMRQAFVEQNPHRGSA
jgi:hypothetical protein